MAKPLIQHLVKTKSQMRAQPDIRALLRAAAAGARQETEKAAGLFQNPAALRWEEHVLPPLFDI
jgi:hypothetical protein